MKDTTAPAAGADTSDARDEGFASVSDAVAELERREKQRAQERKAAKAASAGDDTKAAPVADEGNDDDDDTEAKPTKRKPEPDAKPAKKAAPVAEGEDEDGEEAEDDDGEEDQADEASDDDADDDADDDREPAKKPEPAPAPKVKLKIEGREVEADAAEVQDYVEKGVKYTRETQAIQQERQAIDQGRQQLQQHVKALQDQAQALAQMAQAVIGTEPDLALAQQDPQTYLVQQGMHRQRIQAYQQIMQQSQAAAQQAHALQQQQQGEAVARERASILKAMPELADSAKLASFQGRAAQVAQEYGYSGQDMQGMFDHRFYVMLRDLGRLRDMEAARAKGAQKLAAAPAKQLPGPQASSQREGPRDAKKAKAEFLRSPRTLRDVKRALARMGD